VKKRLKKKLLLAAVGLIAAAGGAVGMSSCLATGKGAAGARLEAMQASPNWRDGKFINGLPGVEPSYFKALVKWARGADDTVPDGPLPVVARRASDFDAPPASGLRVTWLGHSSLLIELEGRRLLVDPVWSERASPFSWTGPKRFHPPPLPLEELPAIDAVVISHDHFDHLDHRTVEALGARAPRYVVPLGVGAHLESWGVDRDRIVERDWWGEVKVGHLTLTATPARHFSGRSLVMADRDETLWAGWAIAGRERRIYYSGDTAMFPGFAAIGERLGPFDAVLIEIGAYNQLWADAHVGPEQAVAARLALGSGLLVPVHWGTFDLALHSWTEPVERLLVAAEAAGVAVAVPRPGESVEPADPPEVARWWPALEWQTAAEAPVVSSGLGQP
jgi:L-ascorbate metabolism protein UlaG (beta-lactamase superfamily)